jgi:hypothetical protein
MCDLLARQANESPVRIMQESEKYPACFVCGQPITEGQEYYKVLLAWQKRHVGCARKSVGVLPPYLQSEDEARRYVRSRVTWAASSRRGRDYSHNGGDGYVDV